MGTHVVPASLQQTGLARGVAERQTDTLSPSLFNAPCLASLFLCKPRRSLQPGLAVLTLGSTAAPHCASYPFAQNRAIWPGWLVIEK